MNDPESAVKVQEAFYADWEPIPFDFVDLYELFVKEVISPVADKTAEKSCDL